MENNQSYILKNVLLETGFEYQDNEVVKTRTGLFCVTVAQGRIQDIRANDPDINGIDAKGHLMLPAFKDMHAHLDKMLFGLPWQAVAAKRKTVRDMIAYEQEMIPEWLDTSVARTEKLIDFLQAYGTDLIRSHFNVDPTSGLKSLEHLEQALANRKTSVDAELVAFPQHGLFYTDTLPILKEVAKLDPVSFIGGVDPYSLDGSVEKPMEAITNLALEHDKGIDIHLHEMGDSGIRTINFLIDRVNEHPQLRDRAFVSHAFALSRLSDTEAAKIAERLAAAGVGIVSSVPFGNMIMPIPTLRKYGVKVLIGNDNIQDHWNTFGSGNMLQKANLIAALYGYSTEWQLSRTLAFATRYQLPLDDQGKQQWPAKGDEASLVLVAASCSAEAVSRISQVRSLIHKGHIVF